MQKLQKQHNCIPDEHYVQTLIAVSNDFIFAFLIVLYFPDYLWLSSPASC